MDLKISRKTFTLPNKAQTSWKFEKRPGGWIVAESPQGRKRVMIQESRGRLHMSLGGSLFLGEWIQNKRDSRGLKTASGCAGDLIAQFPGKVRKIVTQKGVWVKEGDALLLIEAMKMEFSIRAPYAGRIKEVLVTEGQQLSPGDQFVELEAGESDH